MDLRLIDTKIKELSEFTLADGLDVLSEKITRIEKIPVCEDIINAFKPKIKILNGRVSKKCIARYDNNRILIPHRKFFQSSAMYYMVLFHEFAHWLTPRMGRNHSGGDVKYATEEITAQLTACYLINLLGLRGGRKVVNDTASYLMLFKAGNLKTARRRAKIQARVIIGFCAKQYA